MPDVGLLALPVVFLLGGLLLRGTVAPRSRFSQIARANYVTGSVATTWLPFAYRRFIAAILPLAFVFGFLVFLPVVGAESRMAGWLMLLGCGVSGLVAAIAFIWPRRFIPQWMRDVDGGRDIKVDPAMLLKAQRANRPLSPRVFRLANVACLALLLVATSVHAQGSVFFGICMGWSILLAGQHAQ